MKHPWLWLPALALFGGCTTPPPMPAVAGFEPPERFHADAAVPAGAAGVDSPWWTGFGRVDLDTLVSLALQNNRDLAVAKARIDQARAQAAGEHAALLPMLGLDAQISRWRSSRNIDPGLSIEPASSANPTTSPALSVTPSRYGARTRLPLDASWEADLWGRLAAGARASELRAVASREDFEAARLSLATAVVTTELQRQTHRAQHTMLLQMVALQGRIAQGLREQAASGLGDASAADYALAAAADLRQQAARMHERATLDLDALALVCGTTPGALPVTEGTLPAAERLPAAADVPSSVLQRRPDVRRAQAELDAALQQVAAVRADFFPRLMLTGSTGLESSALAALLDPGSTIWSLAAQITVPLFDGGRRQAQFSAARAQLEQASQGFQATALRALREVEDALTTLASLHDQLDQAHTAAAAAERAASRARRRADAGLGTRIAAMEAQLAAMQQQLSLLDLRGQLFVARATLHKVLAHA